MNPEDAPVNKPLIYDKLEQLGSSLTYFVNLKEKDSHIIKIHDVTQLLISDTNVLSSALLSGIETEKRYNYECVAAILNELLDLFKQNNQSDNPNILQTMENIAINSSVTVLYYQEYYDFICRMTDIFLPTIARVFSPIYSPRSLQCWQRTIKNTLDDHKDKSSEDATLPLYNFFSGEDSTQFQSDVVEIFSHCTNKDKLFNPLAEYLKTALSRQLKCSQTDSFSTVLLRLMHFILNTCLSESETALHLLSTDLKSNTLMHHHSYSSLVPLGQSFLSLVIQWRWLWILYSITKEDKKHYSILETIIGNIDKLLNNHYILAYEMNELTCVSNALFLSPSILSLSVSKNPQNTDSSISFNTSHNESHCKDSSIPTNQLNVPSLLHPIPSNCSVSNLVHYVLFSSQFITRKPVVHSFSLFHPGTLLPKTECMPV